jgi:hypothetical protein
MSLQRFTMGHMPGLPKVVCGMIVMLRFSTVVRGTMTPLAPCGLGWMTIHFPLIEQGTHPTASLISKQAIPYRTCGGTCCLSKTCFVKVQGVKCKNIGLRWFSRFMELFSLRKSHRICPRCQSMEFIGFIKRWPSMRGFVAWIWY